MVNTATTFPDSLAQIRAPEYRRAPRSLGTRAARPYRREPRSRFAVGKQECARHWVVLWGASGVAPVDGASPGPSVLCDPVRESYGITWPIGGSR
jgi:hypothetical protein